MPSMANIVVKKNDGTTDITYTALTPSAGDSVAAQWRENTPSIAAFRPFVSMRTQFNGPRTARRFVMTGKFPVEDTGVLLGTIPFTFEGTIPLGVTDTAVNEAVSQFTNLVVSTLIRDSLKAGYAPT